MFQFDGHLISFNFLDQKNMHSCDKDKLENVDILHNVGTFMLITSIKIIKVKITQI